MDDAKGIRHSADCERNQFIKELKILKQRASQLRCQIGEMVLVSERMEKGEKRCSQLQRRLESCDTRVGELEEELSTRTQEVELARQTYRLLRKDLEQFNKNLTSADESTSTRMDGGRKDGKGGRGGGSRRRKREDAPSQQLETVKTKRRKKSDNKQEEEKDREEEERSSKVTGQTESSAGQFGGEEEQGEGKEEGGGGKEEGGGGKEEGGGGKEEGGREGCEADAEQEMSRSPKNSSSYVISNDCNSTKFKSSVEMTQPLQLPPDVTSVSKKTSCLPSIRISEVHPRGNYIRIINASQSQEGDLGNHFLLQRYQDAPFTVFRFPASVRLPPLGVATVWSASGAAEESSAGRQLPTADFIFTSQPIWASGPDCITILCRPNEQALKWLSSGPLSLSKRSADQPRFRPSSQTTKKTKRQNLDKKSSSTRNPRGREEEETTTPVKVDPVKESQTKAASGWKDERGRDGKRLEDSRQTTSDSSPDGRTFVQRKKGVALTASATDESDLERRRRTGEARKRKKREEKASTKQEEECLGCEEEIRVNRIRREKEDTSGKKRGDEEEKEEEEDCWKRGAAIIMNKTIPCTFVHIIDEAPTSSTGRKDSDGGGRGEGGGGGCVSERSECGESRDCDDTTRSPTNSKCCNTTVSESNVDDDDCRDCSESSPRRKRLGHASLNRCVESREGSMMGSSTSRKNDCKERKETWNGSQGRRRVERECEEEKEESFQGRKTAGCCPSEEQEEDEEEDDCSPRRRKEKTVSPLRKSNCDECYDVTRKKKEEECVQEKRHRSMGCGGGGVKGGGVRGGGVRGGGAEGGCGGGAKRRTKERKECDDDCCEKEEGSWSKWKKWLAGMVVGGGGGSGGRKEGGYCEDQPCFSPAPSTAPAPAKCGDRGKSVADTEVRCIDQVQVRERCPTYRPRLEKGALCRCPDGCPACPPKRADCSEEVDLIERRRPTKKKQELEKKECKCAEKHKGDAAARSSSSSRCLRETTSATCHLDSMALTAASVMAAGLTVAAIYCH